MMKKKKKKKEKNLSLPAPNPIQRWLVDMIIKHHVAQLPVFILPNGEATILFLDLFYFQHSS
jgi:hypothetical protein